MAGEPRQGTGRFAAVTGKTPKFVSLAIAAAVAAPAPAAAESEESAGRRVMVGVGIQAKPRYPGAADGKITFLPLVDVWRDGEPMTVETPDEAIGFALIGKRRGPFAAGPAMAFAPTRSASAIPGLPKIGFGVEAGAFAEVWPLKSLRLRAELRQGIGGHKALTGDLAADLVWRRGNEGPVFTAGPRLRWGSTRYNRSYFGVPQPGTANLAAFDPGSGIYAVGAQAGLRLPISRSVGLYGYAGYDRLTGRVADSPIVSAGSRDQLSGGLALTYRFGL